MRWIMRTREKLNEGKIIEKKTRIMSGVFLIMRSKDAAVFKSGTTVSIL